MQSLTANEAKVMDFLVRNFHEKNSINEIARRLNLSPMGSYKILKKFEKIDAVKVDKIGQALYYKANLDSEIGIKLAELVLVQNELNSYAKVQAEDFEVLKEITLSCILFGSVITKGKEANDIDVFLVLDRKNYKEVSKRLREIKERKPKKIQDVMATKEDLIKNIKQKDEVILDILKTGKVLWGSEIIVEAIKHGSS